MTGASRPRTPPPGGSPLDDVRLLTVSEVAAAARLSRVTIYRLIENRKLEAIRVGRSYRIPEDAALRCLGMSPPDAASSAPGPATN